MWYMYHLSVFKSFLSIYSLKLLTMILLVLCIYCLITASFMYIIFYPTYWLYCVVPMSCTLHLFEAICKSKSELNLVVKIQLIFQLIYPKWSMNNKTYGLQTPCLLKPKCKSPDKRKLQVKLLRKQFHPKCWNLSSVIVK